MLLYPTILPGLYKMNTPATTFPFFPLWTFCSYAGHQGRIKIRFQVIVNYRIFLAAPVSFHDMGSALVLKEWCRARGEIENVQECHTV